MNRQYLKTACAISAVMALATLAALALIDEHLKNTASPLGMVSFELCAYTANCHEIVGAWTTHAQIMAALSLGLDYLFMVAYPAAICFGLLWAAPRLRPAFQRVATALAWGIWLAGVADAVENYHLFQMLLGQPSTWHPWAATAAATLKFALLIPALLVWLATAFRRR
jgi:hypothetical protein